MGDRDWWCIPYLHQIAQHNIPGYNDASTNSCYVAREIASGWEKPSYDPSFLPEPPALSIWYRDVYQANFNRTQVRPGDIRDWRVHQQQVEHADLATINHRLVVVKRFLKWGQKTMKTNSAGFTFGYLTIMTWMK